MSDYQNGFNVDAPTATIDPVTVTGTRPPAEPAPTTSPTPNSSQPGSFYNADGSMNFGALIGAGTTLFNGSKQASDQAALGNQFTGLSEKYATQMDPYGAYRKAAADRLEALNADPSSVVNTPGYKFSLQQGLGAVANRDNRSLGVGAGSTNPDLMNYAQGLASKTYNDTVSQLSQQAGVGIGPNAAASLLQTGMLGKLASQQASNAAGGANVSNAGRLIAGLAPGALSLFKQLTNAGLSPTQAAQLARSFGGNLNTGSGPGVSDATTSDGGNGAAQVGPGTGWTYDQNGNIVQDTAPVDGGYDFGGG